MTRRLQCGLVCGASLLISSCTSSGDFDLETVCSNDAIEAAVNFIENPPIRCDCVYKTDVSYSTTVATFLPDGRLSFTSRYSPFLSAASSYGTAYITITNPNPKGCNTFTSVTSDADWITSPNVYSSDGVHAYVHYSVAANPSAFRSGTITVGNLKFTVQQPGR